MARSPFGQRPLPVEIEWSGSDGTPAPPPEKGAAEIWELGVQHLVGVLDSPCQGEWWLPAAERVPKVSVPEHAAADVRRAALAAFQRLPSYLALQRGYAQEHGANAGPWVEDPGQSQLDVWVFSPGGGAQLIWVVAEAGNYCGSFYGALNALFERKPGAPLRLLGALEEEASTPVSAFDFDGDGRLEILTGPNGLESKRGLLHRDGETIAHDVLTSIPFLGCPC